MSKKLDLIYKLEGPQVDEGIDVFQLAPILLSIGKLIDESNKTINPDGPTIAVNVKPFEKGSFVVDILIFSHNNAQALMEFVNSSPVKDIKEVLEWLGIIQATTGVPNISLLGLIKILNGRPQKVEKLGPNEYTYYAEDNISVTVNSEVHALMQNIEIKQLVYNVYGNPIREQGISQIRNFIKGEDEQTTTVITEDEAEALQNFVNAEIPLTEDEELIENRNIQFLYPKRGSFEAEAGSWSFRKSANRDDVITATIRDQIFLSKVGSGEIRPYYKDLIKAEVVERQKRKGQILTTTYEIIKVLEYIKANDIRQLAFPDD